MASITIEVADYLATKIDDAGPPAGSPFRGTDVVGFGQWNRDCPFNAASIL